jgi:pilus assembly protein Flp/PilA
VNFKHFRDTSTAPAYSLLSGGHIRVALHHWEEPFTMTKIAAKVQTLLNRERGATAVEYGLLVALIAVVIIVAVQLLGNNLSTTFDNVAKKV